MIQFQKLISRVQLPIRRVQIALIEGLKKTLVLRSGGSASLKVGGCDIFFQCFEIKKRCVFTVTKVRWIKLLYAFARNHSIDS